MTKSYLGFDGLLQGLEVFDGGGPLEHEDLSGKLTPEGVELLLGVVAQFAEVVEEIGRTRVVTAFQL